MASSGRRPRMTDLCRALNTSERTLRYAFMDVVGMSPARYLKGLRLNRVHRALLAGDPTSTLVKEVAFENGFWHLPQFARSYQQLFAELPSETLRR